MSEKKEDNVNDLDFEILKGKTLIDVQNKENKEIIFTAESGEMYRLIGKRPTDDVYIDEIIGDLKALIGFPLIFAIESFEMLISALKPKGYDKSFTWSFYRLATRNQEVIIRWHREYNGYFFGIVGFEKVENNEGG